MLEIVASACSSNNPMDEAQPSHCFFHARLPMLKDFDLSHLTATTFTFWKVSSHLLTLSTDLGHVHHQTCFLASCLGPTEENASDDLILE